MAPLVTTVELQLGASWVDVTSYAYVRDGISIRRGRADESFSPSPAQCRLTLNNRDGRFSPRNPTGPYYGLIGRNTPLRVSIDLGLPRMISTDASPRSFSAPDSAGLSITGDIDLRYDGSLLSWDANSVLLSKYTTAGNQRSYRMFTDTFARIVMQWSNDGTAEPFATSTVAVPRLTGRQAIRATLDVDNGAGGKTVTFYTAPTIAGPWTQLGDVVTTAGTTSVFDSTATLSVTALSGGAAYAAQVLQGIAGTARANPDFTAQISGATSFADAAGNTWTAGASAALTNRRVRFVGEVSAWPIGWDYSEQDVVASVTAAGIRRRLGQGQSPFKSPMTRALTAATGLIAYWPMEDGSDATQFGSGLVGGTAMSLDGAITPAADSESFEASGPLPTWSGGQGYGSFPASATGTYQVRFLATVPTSAITPGGAALLMSMRFAGGDVERVDLAVNSSGSLNMGVYGPVNPTTGSGFIDGTGFIGFGVLNRTLRYEMYVVQSGADVTIRIGTLDEGATSGSLYPQNVLGRTLGSLVAVTVAPVGTGVLTSLAAVTIGQVSVQNTTTGFYDLSAVLDGYAGESAADRVERLTLEEGVPSVIRGIDLGSELLGVQGTDTLLNLVDQAAYTDGGISSEEIGSAKLMMRTLRSLYNQPSISIAYTKLREFEPTEDDQAAVNDLTITRVGGATGRYELTSGALSTQNPPAGIGRYDSSEELSLATDAQVVNQASWRVHVGTVDEPRNPVVTLDLLTAAGITVAEQTALLDMIEGDAFTILDPPTFAGAPDDVTQLLAGWSETITPFTYEFAAVGIPATPYRAWQIQSAEYGRLDSTTTLTNEPLDATETGVDFTGDAWITTAGRPQDFPFDIEIGGEVMTVTANSASTNGTFTVTRSVNGVVKSHAAGAAITLARPVHLALV